MKIKCCICGKEQEGFGHNPQGAMDNKDKWRKWKAEDRCCDDCNSNVVIPGRIKFMQKNR